MSKINLNSLLNDKKLLVESAKKHFMDISIPLEERWNIFEEMSTNNLLASESYGDGFIDTLDKNLTLYDDFFCDRYETKMYTNMLEKVMEDNEEEPGTYSEENIAKWKEKVLASGNQSFTNDW